MSLLETSKISVAYGGLRAVHEVSISVPRGAIVGLIGPNGAGKTTLIDALTGFTPTCGGAISFCGESITRMSAYRRARLGLARTFQSLELFDDLTVLENLQVAAERQAWWKTFVGMVHPGRALSAASSHRLLGLFELEHLADRVPSELSQGQRKLVSVARALASEPRVVLLDEPAAGLDSPESNELGVRLRSMVADGLTILLVDHDMGLVLNVCDSIYVLDFGRLIASGSPAEIRRNPEVIGAYLGESQLQQAAGDDPRRSAS